MTGPEHFKMAEELLKACRAAADPENDNSDEEVTFLVGLMMQRAQIHATLAHAAATADLFALSGQEGRDSAEAWRSAVSVNPPASDEQAA